MAFLGAKFDLGVVVDYLRETAEKEADGEFVFVWLEEGLCLVIYDVPRGEEGRAMDSHADEYRHLGSLGDGVAWTHYIEGRNTGPSTANSMGYGTVECLEFWDVNRIGWFGCTYYSRRKDDCHGRDACCGCHASSLSSSEQHHVVKKS